jgi:hypothetical protein
MMRQTVSAARQFQDFLAAEFAQQIAQNRLGKGQSIKMNAPVKLRTLEYKK